MRDRLRLGLGLSLVVALALLSVRCFSPDLAVCAYICNGDAPRCPDEYECRADHYCHKKGSTDVCPYRMDLGPAPPDQSTPPDLLATDAGDGGADAASD